MSESVGIVCPVCRSELRLKGSVLSKVTVPCPKCGTTLDVPKSETPAAPAPQTSSPAPAAIPPSWKASTQAQKPAQPTNSNTQSEFSSDTGGTRCGGFLSWVGYGLLAAVVGIILQTVLGYTNYLFPLLIATIATGSMVGAAVRYAAGENNGWGPGIVAVLIAAFAIFAGRVGAFSVSPDVDKILGLPAAPLTPQEAEARVVQETTEPFLVAGIAEEVEYDEDFLSRENLDDDAVTDFWLEHSEEEDPSKRYMPAIWAEATHRWNRNSPEQKETIRKNKELKLREVYGIMSKEGIQERIDQATTEEAMIAEIANTLYEDEEWLTRAGITENQIDEHFENTDFDGASETESQHLAPVWVEAKRRWGRIAARSKAGSHQRDDRHHACRACLFRASSKNCRNRRQSDSRVGHHLRGVVHTLLGHRESDLLDLWISRRV